MFPFLVVDFPCSLLIGLQTPRNMYHQHYGSMLRVFSSFCTEHWTAVYVCEDIGACASHPAL